MFKDCESLRQLNAKRAELSLTVDLPTLNAAYNQRRTEILNSRATYMKLTPVYVTVEPPVKYSGIPIAGRSNRANTIELTATGFLF